MTTRMKARQKSVWRSWEKGDQWYHAQEAEFITLHVQLDVQQKPHMSSAVKFVRTLDKDKSWGIAVM